MCPYIWDSPRRPRAHFPDTNNIPDRIEAATPPQPSQPVLATAAACDAAKPAPIRAAADSSGDAAYLFFPKESFSGNSAGALGRIANINLRHQSGLVPVSLRDIFLELAGEARIHQIDRRAAKPTARHARAKHAFLLIRKIHHQVQFAAAHFIQIAQATMRFRHALAEPLDVPGAQRLRAVEHARILGHDVQRALVNNFGQQVPMLLQLLQRHIAQRFNPRQNRRQPPHRLFAIRTPPIVFARRQLVLHHRVADNQLHRIRYYQRLKRQRSAIEQQRVIFLAVQRDKLIHDSHARADKLVLGSAAQSRELQSIRMRPRRIRKRQRRRNFDRRRRTQPRAHRHFALDQEIRAALRNTGFLQLNRNADRIVAPRFRRRYGIRRKIDFRRRRKFVRINRQFAIAAWPNRNPAIKFDRGRHREPIVVVGVLADQIDAAGRAKHPGRTRKPRTKSFFDIRNARHGGLHRQARRLSGSPHQARGYLTRQFAARSPLGHSHQSAIPYLCIVCGILSLSKACRALGTACSIDFGGICMARGSASRRSFLKLAGAGVAGTALSAAASSYARIAGANDRVGVGIIGFSDRFKNSLAPAFLKSAAELNFEFVALCDIWSKRREDGGAFVSKLPGGRQITLARNNEELYENKDVQAVIISTPDFQHASQGVEALKAERDAYIEKPLANTMEDARAIRSAVKGTDRVVAIGTQRRSSPTYQRIHDYMKSGGFGDLVSVELTWNVNQPGRWRRPRVGSQLHEADTDWKRFLP